MVTRLHTFVTIHVVTRKTVKFKVGNLLPPFSKLQSVRRSALTIRGHWTRVSGRSIAPSPTLCDGRAHARESRVTGPLEARTKRETVRKRRSPWGWGAVRVPTERSPPTWARGEPLLLWASVASSVKRMWGGIRGSGCFSDSLLFSQNGHPRRPGACLGAWILGSRGWNGPTPTPSKADIAQG